MIYFMYQLFVGIWPNSVKVATGGVRITDTNGATPAAVIAPTVGVRVTMVRLVTVEATPAKVIAPTEGAGFTSGATASAASAIEPVFGTSDMPLTAKAVEPPSY